MGGAKIHSRGIDEEGNSANCVEVEQIVINQKKKDNVHKSLLSSFVQMRGSIPVFWQQQGSKITESRSLESSTDAFMRHLESVFNDYEC